MEGTQTECGFHKGACCKDGASVVVVVVRVDLK